MDKNNTSGFTIIELLVVTAVTLLLTGTGLAYFNNFTAKKKVDVEATKFIDVLDLAKKKAHAGDASQCGGSPRAVSYYSVRITANNQYELVPNCTSGTPTTIPYPTMKSPVQFDTAAADIKFNNLNVAGTTAANAAISVKVQDAAASPTNCQLITVDTQGTVLQSNCP